MNEDFNPLNSRALWLTPERLHIESTWSEHVPFAMLLVELHRPRAIVELGTHWGISYGAWCQAVAALKLDTRCYAVDTWAGDEHAGKYDDTVYKSLQQHHHKYESFSKLLRMTFDQALAQIPDHSVDLLHIDGLHYYEAVKHDFDTWLPKMTDRGVILFHDTVVTARGFGVHTLWAELSAKYPNFNFEHGYGLGVLGIGSNLPAPTAQFLVAANRQPQIMRQLFAALGGRIRQGVEREHDARQAQVKRPLWHRGLRKIKNTIKGR